MRLNALKLICAAALALMATCAPGYEIFYLGDVAPDTPGSCGYSQGRSFSWTLVDALVDDPLMGSLVDDPAAIDGKAYRVNDNSGTMSLRWRTTSTGDNNIDSGTGATVIARVKVDPAADVDGGGCIGFREGAGISTGYHWGQTTIEGTPYAHVMEFYRGAETVLGAANDGNYHILRITAKSAGGAQTTVPYAEPFAYADGNLSGQGGWSGSAGAEVYVISGEVQVTIGAPETSADRIVWCDPDSNGKITVEARLERGVQYASEGWVSSLKILDRSGTWIAGWQADCDEVKGRVGGVATPLVSIQDDADGSALLIEIDVGANTARYEVDGVTIGTLECTGNNVGMLQICRFNETRPELYYGQTVLWDDLAMSGTPVSGRTVNLYLDENPTPVLTILNATHQGRSPDSFQMGALSDTGLEDVYLDWIAGTSAGAFAPGEEEATLGYSLPISDTVATTVQDAKAAPLNTEVVLSSVPISSYYYGGGGSEVTHLHGFAVGDPDRSCGMRVICHTDAALLTGFLYNVRGIVVDDNGERVINASYVEMVDFGWPIEALGMGGGGGGGRTGLQGPTVRDAYVAGSDPAYRDEFTYADGNLVGNNSWTGNAGSDIAVVGNRVKVSGDWDTTTASVPVVATDCGTGVISVKIKIQQGVGDDNYWYLHLAGEPDNDFAYWMGSGSHCVGRAPTGEATDYVTLTGGVDEIEVRIIPGTDQSQFYFNGSLINNGTLPHPAAAGDVLQGITLERIDRFNTNIIGHYVWFDDLRVTPSPMMSVGQTTAGLYAKIYGKVVYINETPLRYEDRYFYVDDGSGVRDGSGYAGVRCSPSSESYLAYMPVMNDYVAVQGIMGIQKLENSLPARYLYTWNFSDPYNW